MDRVPAKNAPSFGGWFMAAGAAAVAFGVAMVVFDFRVEQASLVAMVLFVAVGLILGQPDRPMPADPLASARAKPAAGAAPAAAAHDAPAAPRAAVAMAQAAPVAAVAEMPAASEAAGRKPEGLSGPRGGKADDLKEIEGIGPAMEKLCNSLGFFHFDQIAKWTTDELAWVDANLKGFKGRASRDKWVAQAKIIVAEGLDAFRERAKTNNY